MNVASLIGNCIFGRTRRLIIVSLKGGGLVGEQWDGGWRMEDDEHEDCSKSTKYKLRVVVTHIFNLLPSTF